MSGGATIQWVALVLCIVFAVIRMPDALRGKGRCVFVALVLLVVAVALSLNPIYLVVDGLLGGVNVANLILRLNLFAIVVLLGVRCAGAFTSVRARKLIVGPIGIAALLLAVGATVALFAASDLPISSTGLRAYTGQTTVQWYADTGRLYPAYVAACLFLPALAEAGSRSLRPVHRVATALIAAGFFLVFAYGALNLLPLELGGLNVLLAFGAIVLVTTGLTTVWASRRHAAKQPPRNFLAQEQKPD